jgi:CBS domain-containing protein
MHTGLTAADVMNRDVFTVHVDSTVRELVALLSERQISGAPVIDAEGQLVGVVSVTDVAQSKVERPDLVADRSNPGTPLREWQQQMNSEDLLPLHVESDDVLVGDIMTPKVYTIPEDTPVTTIAQTMVAGHVHRLFVTRRRRVVGIVTSLDLVKLLDERWTRDAAAATGPARSAGRLIRPHVAAQTVTR